MKVIVAVIFAIGSASSLGSGPYLPSGWRPQGPAFYLPGEVQKPELKETILFEEASGSNSLREYGPPKAQEIQELFNINQGLPDVATEQAFQVIDNAASVVEENLDTEVNTEQKSEAFQEATSEQSAEKATETISRIADIELQYDAATVSYEAEVTSEFEATTASVEAKVELVENEQVVEEKLEPVVEEKFEQVVEEKLEQVVEEKLEQVVEAKPEQVVAEKLEQVVEEKIEQVVLEEVSVVDQGVKNIAQALVNLENEIKAEQIQSVEPAGEVKINQEESGSTQVPEGLLEYGLPGFREYGPPKGDELLRSAIVVQESSPAFLENNEARRRRFSPKFRSTKNKRPVARH